MKEWSVEDRAALIKAACSKKKLSPKMKRQLQEVLYTVSELGDDCDYFTGEFALKMHSMVQMILEGKYSEDMRL